MAKVGYIGPTDSARTTVAPALSTILAEAMAELALAQSGAAEPTDGPERASRWMAVLVPLWRKMVSQTGPAEIHGSGRPALYADIDMVLQLIDGFVAVLAARVPQAVRDFNRNAAIQNAKQEWEGTVDALTSMVCMLDSNGLVMRANRVVEQWNLGSVGSVIGKKAHAVLHPVCIDPTCNIARGLRDALPRLKRGEPHEFEFYSRDDAQTLQFTLRPIRSAQEASPEERDGRSVLVITDVSALRRAEQALVNINLNLESRVLLRTRELDESNRDLRNEVVRRERAENDLRASRNNLSLLSEQLIQAQEGERRRIALELHDSVGQSLSAIKYTLERALIMVQRPGLGDPANVLASAVERIHETADGIRAISMNLRPQILDSLGAASATSWFCRTYAEIYSGITMHADISAQNSEIPKRISTHLFRCVQELLNNVSKHARAKTVWVVLKREDSLLSLEVRDDGTGMLDDNGSAARLTGSGIRNLRERAEMTAGEFALSSMPGFGTSANIVWQLAADEIGESSSD